jgi:hypothetical protein
VKAALVLGAVLLAPWPARGAVTEIHYVMGTYFRITAEDADARPALRRCFTEARRLERVFSRFDPRASCRA